MNAYLTSLWQFNIEVSLLLLMTLFARFVIRKTTKIYNAYLLWLSIPIGLAATFGVRQSEFSAPEVEPVSIAITNYVIAPASNVNQWQLLGYLSVVISALLLFRLIAQHLNLRAELRLISVDIDLDLLSDYPIVAVDKPGLSPAVYGFIQPRIYFPIDLLDELSENQISLVLEHEQHHITQQHLWMNLAWDMLVCVLWFNPLAYVSRQGFRHDQELYCDYLVLHKTSKQSRQSYGHALLSTVSATHSVSLLCSWKTVNQLEERIMNIKKSSSAASKILLLMFSTAIVACMSVYAISAENVEKHKKIIKIHAADTGQKSIIKINKDGKTFIEEDGKRSVLEHDQRRDMTDEEEAEFDQDMHNVEVNILADHELKSLSQSGGSKQIRIIQAGDGEISEHDWQEIHNSIREAEIEIETQHDEFAIVQHELKEAQKEIEAAHQADELSVKAMRKAQKQIESTQESLLRDKAKMRLALEQARAEVERLRIELKREK